MLSLEFLFFIHIFINSFYELFFSTLFVSLFAQELFFLTSFLATLFSDSFFSTLEQNRVYSAHCAPFIRKRSFAREERKNNLGNKLG